MIAILSAVVLLVFMAAQGAVVFGTAFVALRLLKASHWFAKAASILVSYVVWIVITIVGYFAIGGDGGLMDGFGMVLVLCFTALLSSFVYLLIWTLRSSGEAAS